MRKEYDLDKLTVKRRGLPRGVKRGKTDRARVRITIALDSDVVDFFKQAAEKRGGLPYQTQINQALRQAMEQSSADRLKSALLKDKAFIRSIAREISHGD
jgi:uncharacterized protein (DUF4415 family)